MRNKSKLLLLFVFIISAGGCIRYTYSLVDAKPVFRAEGRGTIAVASQDQRSYVVSGDYKPQAVGVIRGAFGNPLSMTTDSGRPLADEMGDVIVDALQKNGFRAIAVKVTPGEPTGQVIKKLADTGAEKLVHFQIKQWRSDAFNNLRLEYSIGLRVCDPGGGVIAGKEISGDENLGWVAGVSLVGKTRVKVKDAFKEKIEELFNAPEISNALES